MGYSISNNADFDVGHPLLLCKVSRVMGLSSSHMGRVVD